MFQQEESLNYIMSQDFALVSNGYILSALKIWRGCINIIFTMIRFQYLYFLSL